MEPAAAFANKLAHSPNLYLRQHGNHPVAWFPWGEEAFALARSQDKPLLASIGYSSCHWCHVMAHEAFANPHIGHLMNENLVSMKVDREERPDVDAMCMEACKALQGQGGWPLNCFLLPDGRPFYAVTYLPVQQWAQLVETIVHWWINDRNRLLQMAHNLENHRKTRDPFFQQPSTASPFSWTRCYHEKWQPWFDPIQGAFRGAPKFPMPASLCSLYHLHWLDKVPASAVAHAQNTLRQIALGGIHDWVGGGFCRYSVDDHWHIPHFEKMLYDNAQLLSAFSLASMEPGASQALLQQAMRGILQWLRKEMAHPQGGYNAALDADSEGEEGKFYCWSWQELEEVLGAATRDFANAFGCRPEGNWEPGSNLPHLTEGSANDFHTFAPALQRLSQARATRVRPAMDSKVIVEWNALLAQGLLDASLALDSATCLAEAQAILHLLWENSQEGTRLPRCLHNSAAAGCLGDYAQSSHAMLSLSHLDPSGPWKSRAAKLCHTALELFAAPHSPLLYSSDGSDSLLTHRMLEGEDNVISSGNAIMAQNLLWLSEEGEHIAWKERALDMLSLMATTAAENPGFHSAWVLALAQKESGRVALGKNSQGQWTVCLGKRCLAPVPHYQDLWQPLSESTR